LLLIAEWHPTKGLVAPVNLKQLTKITGYSLNPTRDHFSYLVYRGVVKPFIVHGGKESFLNAVIVRSPESLYFTMEAA